MNYHKAIIIACLLASVDFYLVGCTSNPEPNPLDKVDKGIIVSMLTGLVKNQTTTTTETTTPMITTTVRSTTLENVKIEDPPMKLTGSEDIPRTEDPLILESGWPDREISVTEKMILITIAVVAIELIAYRVIERGFQKLNNPDGSILGSHAV